MTQPSMRDAPAPARPPRGRSEVSEALIRATTELVSRHESDGVSVRDIAATAGVNHALIFRHFGSKQRLLDVALDRQRRSFSGSVRSLDLRAHPDATDEPPARSALATFDVARPYWQLLARSVITGGPRPEDEEALRPHLARRIERVAAKMATASPRDPVTTPEVLVAATSAIVCGWLVYEAPVRELVGVEDRPAAELAVAVVAAAAEMGNRLRDGSVPPVVVDTRRGRAPRQPDAAPEPPSRRPRGEAEVRSAILAAAAALFSQQGFEAVSVRDIAARARVNHALIFRYFDSKDALIVEVVHEQARRAVALAEEVESSRDDLYPMIHAAQQTAYARLLAIAMLDADTGRRVQQGLPTSRHLYDLVVSEQAAAPAGHGDDRVDPAAAVLAASSLMFGWTLFEPLFRRIARVPDDVDSAMLLADLSQVILDLAR